MNPGLQRKRRGKSGEFKVSVAKKASTQRPHKLSLFVFILSPARRPILLRYPACLHRSRRLLQTLLTYLCMMHLRCRCVDCDSGRGSRYRFSFSRSSPAYRFQAHPDLHRSRRSMPHNFVPANAFPDVQSLQHTDPSHQVSPSGRSTSLDSIHLPLPRPPKYAIGDTHPNPAHLEIGKMSASPESPPSGASYLADEREGQCSKVDRSTCASIEVRVPFWDRKFVVPDRSYGGPTPPAMGDEHVLSPIRKSQLWQNRQDHAKKTWRNMSSAGGLGKSPTQP